MKCTTCGEDKSQDRFKTYDHGYGLKFRRKCRDCDNRDNRRRYKKDKKYRERCNAAVSKWAKQHQHAYELEKRYGLSREDYYKLVEMQQGCCALCRKQVKKRKRVTRLAVDHDHKTGRVRGLLCTLCNIMLGRFGDDVEKFENVVRYLKGEEKSNFDSRI